MIRTTSSHGGRLAQLPARTPRAGTLAQSPPAQPAPAAAQQPAPGRTIVLTLPDGRMVPIPMDEAVRLGIVALDANGNPSVTMTGKQAMAQVSAMATGQLQDVAGAAGTMTPQHGADAGAVPATGTAPATGADPAADASVNEAADGKPAEAKPKEASAQLAELANLAFLARGVLKIAQGPGLPKWHTAYMAANALDKAVGGKILPESMKKGPLKDALTFSLMGMMTKSSWDAMVPAVGRFKGYIAAEHAAEAAARVQPPKPLPVTAAPAPPPAPSPAPVPTAATPPASPAPAPTPPPATPPPATVPGRPSVKAVVKALFHNETDHAAKAKMKADLKVAGQHSFIGKAFSLITPLWNTGVLFGSLADISSLVEYTRDNGTGGYLGTQSGRGAVLGAASGALFIGATFLPPSPFSLFADFGSLALWVVQTVNGKGWLDSVLGGDPKKPGEGLRKDLGLTSMKLGLGG